MLLTALSYLPQTWLENETARSKRERYNAQGRQVVLQERARSSRQFLTRGTRVLQRKMPPQARRKSDSSSKRACIMAFNARANIAGPRQVWKSWACSQHLNAPRLTASHSVGLPRSTPRPPHDKQVPCLVVKFSESHMICIRYSHP